MTLHWGLSLFEKVITPLGGITMSPVRQAFTKVACAESFHKFNHTSFPLLKRSTSSCSLLPPASPPLPSLPQPADNPTCTTPSLQGRKPSLHSKVFPHLPSLILPPPFLQIPHQPMPYLQSTLPNPFSQPSVPKPINLAMYHKLFIPTFPYNLQ